MTKSGRDRSASVDRCRTCFPSSSSHGGLCSPEISAENTKNIKEWDEARCPVCMEHPHNAVLLICSSHEKGCRPYMCNTSSRHSNCLDQFWKATKESTQTGALPENQHLNEQSSVVVSEGSTGSQAVVSEGSYAPQAESIERALSKFVCPLCRGHIKACIVVESARQFMNAKARSCSCETCNFSGNYLDLRKHARLEHPLARPSEADPERQRTWRRLERQRDIGDLISSVQSSFGEESGEYSVVSNEDGSWLAVFLLVRIIHPRNTIRMSTSRARSQSNRRRLTRLWGESYDEENGSSRREDNESSDDDDTATISVGRRRVRRRLSPDNQP